MIIARYFFAFLLVLSALGVISAKKPLNSALWLVLSLFFVAVHFALMEAHFVAAAQVLVYAGAIMVLVIFVIMLLGLRTGQDEGLLSGRSHIPIIALVGAFIAFLVNDIEKYLYVPEQPAEALPEGLGNTELIGEVMFTRFMLPFELTSLLLLGAIIGAVLLAYDRKRPLPEGRGLSAMRRKSEC